MTGFIESGEKMSPIRVVAFVAMSGLLVACQNQAPVHSGTAISPRLDSGVSSDNGGGQRATGDLPSVGVSPQGSAITGVPSGPGAAY
jgi:hypothetical protein